MVPPKFADVGMIKRNVIASTKPDIVIEATGDNYTVTTITSLIIILIIIKSAWTTAPQ